MVRIATLENQLQYQVNLLRLMADRVRLSLSAIEISLQKISYETLIQLVVSDDTIDRFEDQVGDCILKILATQQPMASELRLLFASIKIANQLERMGDAIESLARHLATRQQIAHNEALISMANGACELFNRSYKAMFENEFAGIQDMQMLDDKVDSLQRSLFSQLRARLSQSLNEHEAADALQVMAMASKLEKIADLSCDWAAQIRFARTGLFRADFEQKKVTRVAFIDDDGGVSASIAASVFLHLVQDNVEVRVITLTKDPNIQMMKYAEILQNAGVTLRLFPVVELHLMEWKRTLVAIYVGDFFIDQKDAIPFKTICMPWHDADFRLYIEENDLKSIKEVVFRVQKKCAELLQWIAPSP